MSDADDRRVVLVTGAAKRLGRAIAEDFADRGYRVAVHYRSSAAEAEELADALTGAAAFQADLTDTTAVDRLADAVFAHFGRLDVLVTSAAVFRSTPWPDVSDKDWDFHLDANLKATFRMVRAFSPRMSDNGCIVTFGDWTGQHPQTGYLPYCVSKAGVIAMTKGLAKELAPRLRVNCVCPGTVLPPESADSAKLEQIAAATPLGRIGSPDDIVGAVRFLVEGSGYITGMILNVDGGRSMGGGGAWH
jgi:NAD(P)-dependent dehydrogenase (short-subunit alcohol dehydrogenase family)